MEILTKEATQFGAGIFLSVVVLIGCYILVRLVLERYSEQEQQRYDERQKLNERMLQVIEANVAAATALRDLANQNCQQITAQGVKLDELGDVIRDTHRLMVDVHGATVAPGRVPAKTKN